MHFQKVYAKVCAERAARFEQNARDTSSPYMKHHYLKMAEREKKAESRSLANYEREMASA